jgi:hypothetical protein
MAFCGNDDFISAPVAPLQVAEHLAAHARAIFSLHAGAKSTVAVSGSNSFLKHFHNGC